ncbi:thioredoxin H-type-like protein, partial [Jaminaea rosea]
SKLVVVDFTASWCGPCRMIAPTFESLAKKHTGSVFLKVDVDENAAVARAYSVSAMPTFVFLKNKSVIETLRGANPSQLTSLVE